MSAVKIVLSWVGVTLIAFPLAGYLGWGIGGHVDSVAPALIGGAITGAGIGFVQWAFLRRDLGMSRSWILATSVALAAGLSVGAAVVGYETTRASSRSWVPSLELQSGLLKGCFFAADSRSGTCGWSRWRPCLLSAG